MRLYRLPVTMRELSEDTESRYMAEIGDLPGCRAWGNTAAEALEKLQAVATAFIESYRDRGDQLPAAVERAAIEAGAQAAGEVLIAA